MQNVVWKAPTQTKPASACHVKGRLGLIHCHFASTSHAVTHTYRGTPTHIYWLESEIHKVRLGSRRLQSTGVLMNEQKHERRQCSKECAAVMQVCLMLWHLVRWRSLRATLGPCSSQEGPVPVSRVTTLLPQLCWSACSAEDASPTPTCQALTHWFAAAQCIAGQCIAGTSHFTASGPS